MAQFLVDPVQLRGITGSDLRPVRRWDVLKGVGDEFPRARPGRIGVRIVRGPHNMLGAKTLAGEIHI